MYESQQDLVKKVTNEMRICADMIGNKNIEKQAEYGFIPGLDENESACSILNKVRGIESGIYQVLFTGCFNAGKSTILNALMKREILRTGIRPETAVITKIMFNAGKDQAIIYKKDDIDDLGQSVTEVMELKDFFKKFRVDSKKPNKFSDVDHVDLYLANNGIAGSMVQLVDSPGTYNSSAEDKIARDFAEKADAIVFLINATEAMQDPDRKYIHRYFGKKEMRNVFFVINKINLLNNDDDILDLKDYVDSELEDVFLGKNGKVDIELYNKRVFYLNAYGVLRNRLGEDSTGLSVTHLRDFENFEENLGEFLTSTDKDKETLAAYRFQMAGAYLNAELSVQRQLKNLQMDEKDLQAKVDAIENDKSQIEDQLVGIKNDISSTERDILIHAKEAYDDFLNGMEADWDEYFQEKSDSMSVNYLKVFSAKLQEKFAFWKDSDTRLSDSEKMTEEATQPFVEGINTFVDEHREKWSQNIESLLKKDIDNLAKKLDVHQKQLGQLNIPIDIQELLSGLALSRNLNIASAKENNANLSQIFVTLLIGGIDPEILVKSSAGSMDTSTFIATLVKRNIMDIIILTIGGMIAGNIALIPFIIYKAVGWKESKEGLMKDMIANTKISILNGETDKAGNRIPGLRTEGKAQYINATNATIGGAMRRASTEITSGISGRIADAENELKNAIDMVRSKQNVYEDESSRMGFILEKIEKSISNISELVGKGPLSRDEIKALATGSSN